MHAFEQIVAAILERSGYWVRSAVKVELTKEEKRTIGRPTSPRWELDLVGYNAARNEVVILECKSYLDSAGVSLGALTSTERRAGSRYKLFKERELLDVVSARLVAQLCEAGACLPDPSVRLGMAIGKIASDPRAGTAPTCRGRIRQLRSGHGSEAIAALTAPVGAAVVLYGHSIAPNGLAFATDGPTLSTEDRTLSARVPTPTPQSPPTTSADPTLAIREATITPRVRPTASPGPRTALNEPMIAL